MQAPEKKQSAVNNARGVLKESLKRLLFQPTRVPGHGTRILGKATSHLFDKPEKRALHISPCRPASRAHKGSFPRTGLCSPVAKGLQAPDVSPSQPKTMYSAASRHSLETEPAALSVELSLELPKFLLATLIKRRLAGEALLISYLPSRKSFTS